MRKEDIETVAQEVFVGAFRSLRTYGGRQPLENWLARIARRRCCDYWRDQERHAGTVTAPPEKDQQAWLEHVSSGLSAEAFERECEHKEAAETVQAALAKLDADDRALMESIYFEDLPLKEVAATFGWSLAKVKVQAFRVRKHMQAILERMSAKETTT